MPRVGFEPSPIGPVSPPGAPYRISFERGVRSLLSSQGRTYSGSVTYARPPVGGLGTLVYAETFYDGSGVQIVQLRWVNPVTRRTTSLLVGAHKPWDQNWIQGGWVSGEGARCRATSGGDAYVGSFVMVKVSDRPCKEVPPPKS